MKQIVFVYGSLKEGYWNHDVLGNSKKMSKAVTKEDFILTNCGFPYLIPLDDLADAVRHPTAPTLGELYEVCSEKVMASLDFLEGVGYGHYQHRKVVVIDEEGEEVEAIAYVPCEPEMAARYPSCEIEDGVYVWK